MFMASKNKNKKDGIHGKIFINRNGETLLCRGRLEFLEAVDEMGSISAAARKMGYSYRKAWSLVERTNRSAGRIIIETLSGGQGGGGAKLTPDGKKLIKIFRDFLLKNNQLADKMWGKFRKEFPEDKV
jgi:molybdate transport system regulatory protein